MAKYPAFRLATIQAAPVRVEKDGATDKAYHLIQAAAGQGTTLAAFSETWLPGYPFFLGAPLEDLFWQASAQYIANANMVSRPQTERLCAAAGDNDV